MRVIFDKEDEELFKSAAAILNVYAEHLQNRDMIAYYGDDDHEFNPEDLKLCAYTLRALTKCKEER